jgi:nitroimidazol reductase NimA-like FMN-containing flavoprotein (pyridoxamine 5'-phosphate oxidase superfamily)
MALKELAERECLQLLASRVVGRVAVVVAGEARVFPVNYSSTGVTSCSGPAREPSSTPHTRAHWSHSRSTTAIRSTTPAGA